MGKGIFSSGAVVLTAIVLTALNLRVGIAQIGPVLEEIRADTGMSSTIAGLLGTIPFLCLGLFAFAGAPMMRRIGTRRTVIVSLWLMVVGTLGRALVEVPLLMLLLTFPIGIGIALLTIATPAIVKHRFADRAAFVTGAHVASLSLGAAVIAFTVVPLSKALDDWTWALAIGGLVALLPLPFWTKRLAGEDPPVRPAVRGARPDSQALLLALLFGLQSLTYSVAINWVAAVYVDAGWSVEQASLTTAGMPVMTFVVALLMPALTSVATRSWWILASGICVAIGVGVIAVAPTTLPVLWLLIAGFGISAIFPLVMMLPFDLKEDPGSVAELTAWMVGLGYIVSAVGPTMVGALRDATGGFTASLLTVAAVGLAAGLVGIAKPLRARAPESAEAR